MSETIWSKRLFLITLLLLTATLILVGCGEKSSSNNQSGANQPTGEKSRMIRLTVAGAPQLDPGVGTSEASVEAFVNLYDSLVYPDFAGKIQPMLATEWSNNDDGLEWIFKLRQDVKFHNGDPLKASDVVFSMKRLMTMGKGFAYLYKDVVDNITAVDNYILKITLKEKFGPFLATLPRLYILNERQVVENKKDGSYGEYGDYGAEWLATNDAGSGAYKIVEMKGQDRLIMNQFADYWQPWDPEAPETVEIIISTQAATVRTMMSRHELEISDSFQSDEAFTALDKLPGVDIASLPSGSLMYIMLHTQKAPTDDLHVRRALAYMTDTKMAASFFPGSAPIAGPITKGLPGYTENIRTYEYNLEKAKQELTQSKYAGQFAQYPIDLAWISEVPDEEKVALMLQAAGQELGLTINVVKIPWLTYMDNASRKESTPHASIIFYAPDYSEAGGPLYARYHSNSTGTWQQTEWLENKEIDQMLDNALATLDYDERVKKYEEIQAKLSELCPTVCVFDKAERRAYVDYIYWPGLEWVKEGKPLICMPGYYLMFREFKVDTDKMP